MPRTEPRRFAPHDLVGEQEPGPGLVLTAESAAEVAALADYLALAHLLGPEHFVQLARQATERAASEQTRPAELVHSLIVRRQAPLPDDIPSRMAADVAAVEREITRVGRLQSQGDPLPRVPVGALADLDRDTLRASRLDPIRALGIVPVGYRIDGYVRRVRAGKLPAPPKRDTQTVIVYGLGATNPIAWWRAVSHGEGRLLSWIALGESLGQAIKAATRPGCLPDETAAINALEGWLREGLFTHLHYGDPFAL